MYIEVRFYDFKHHFHVHVHVVVKVLCVECRVSWVRVPPEAAHFSLER